VISFFSTKIEKAYPEALHEYLDEPLFKLLALLVVTYVSNYNFTIGLLLAVIVVFSVTDVSLMSEMSERFINGPALTECGAYDKNHINFTGTAFYPLGDNSKLQKLRGGIENNSAPFDNEVSY
tara:strand:+ start:268 stop:636 length:369 start_codon:yes stop_codon:yes gene_type:complete